MAAWAEVQEQWAAWEALGWSWDPAYPHAAHGGRGRWRHRRGEREREEEERKARLQWEEWKFSVWFEANRKGKGKGVPFGHYWLGPDGREYWDEECQSPRGDGKGK